MSILADAEKMVLDIRVLASSKNVGFEMDVDDYLCHALDKYEIKYQNQVLDKIAEILSSGVPTQLPGYESNFNSDIYQLVSRFLGKENEVGNYSSQELAEKFSGSLDALFDSVNQIVSVINTNLLGQSQELETIRKVIGANIKGDTGYASIKDYLDRIQKAFLAAHNSFQIAAKIVIGEVLNELDPEHLDVSKTSMLKIGPLRKADLFEQYDEKYQRCKRWYTTGQFRERLLREFENQCQLNLNAQGKNL
ncbi:MAG: hypothetical protein ACOYL3_19985 [Desulfuromonadaceae bacterium]